MEVNTLFHFSLLKPFTHNQLGHAAKIFQIEPHTLTQLTLDQSYVNFYPNILFR